MVPEVPAPKILHDHVKIFPVLEGGNHVDDEGVAELFEDGLLVDDGPHAFLQQNPALDDILLGLGDLLHRVDMTILFLLDLPNPAKASRANLVQEFIVVPGLVLEFDGLAFEGGGHIRVIIGVEGSVVAVLFDGLLAHPVLGSGDGHFVVFEGLAIFGGDEDAGGLGDVHVEGEFEIDLIVLFVDLEEQVGRG